MSKAIDKITEIFKKGLPETMTEYRSNLIEVYRLAFEEARIMIDNMFGDLINKEL